MFILSCQLLQIHYFLDDMDSDDEDSQTFNVEFDVFQTKTQDVRRSNSKPFDVLSSDALLESMNALIVDVKSILPIPSPAIRILFCHTKWNKDQLIETYFERTPEVLFSEAHIVNPFLSHPTPASRECQICCTITVDEPLSGLRCGHQFCQDCWTNYLTMQIMSDGHSTAIPCPELRCDILVDDETVRFHIQCPSVMDKYWHLINDDFVMSNKLLKWCPSPTSCSNAIRMQSTDENASQSVQCECGYRFCFSCGDGAHEPANCEQLLDWRRRSAEDAKSMNWISSNTKQCPQCHTAIEKNGGCNHMTCKRCAHDYCWLCLKSYQNHVSCNVVQRDGERALTNWDRFLHYHERFQQQQQSLTFEKELKQRIHDIVCENEELKFLAHAVTVLCDSRYTLMCSYVFAFYVHMCNDLLIFEDNQADFERGIEFLADILEREHAPAQFLLQKQMIIDKSNFCQDRRANMLLHVQEDTSVWRFIEY